MDDYVTKREVIEALIEITCFEHDLKHSNNETFISPEGPKSSSELEISCYFSEKKIDAGLKSNARNQPSTQTMDVVDQRNSIRNEDTFKDNSASFLQVLWASIEEGMRSVENEPNTQTVDVDKRNAIPNEGMNVGLRSSQSAVDQFSMLKEELRELNEHYEAYMHQYK